MGLRVNYEICAFCIREVYSNVSCMLEINTFIPNNQRRQLWSTCSSVCPSKQSSRERFVENGTDSQLFQSNGVFRCKTYQLKYWKWSPIGLKKAWPTLDGISTTHDVKYAVPRYLISFGSCLMSEKYEIPNEEELCNIFDAFVPDCVVPKGASKNEPTPGNNVATSKNFHHLIYNFL
ncbi:hypothetical protein CRE_29084 [Caenorhabditis remanei]|uniref:Uncharacterized protein n=1 Tax=Caenorhabditis remanei TaxID=31234 RepID=E3MWB6_CAERE|nr:hypothetical protein CRE_29084 [Caenorhabditis remanei]